MLSDISGNTGMRELHALPPPILADYVPLLLPADELKGVYNLHASEALAIARTARGDLEVDTTLPTWACLRMPKGMTDDDIFVPNPPILSLFAGPAARVCLRGFHRERSVELWFPDEECALFSRIGVWQQDQWQIMGKLSVGAFGYVPTSHAWRSIDIRWNIQVKEKSRRSIEHILQGIAVLDAQAHSGTSSTILAKVRSGVEVLLADEHLDHLKEWLNLTKFPLDPLDWHLLALQSLLGLRAEEMATVKAVWRNAHAIDITALRAWSRVMTVPILAADKKPPHWTQERYRSLESVIHALPPAWKVGPTTGFPHDELDQDALQELLASLFPVWDALHGRDEEWRAYRAEGRPPTR